jgi:CAAX protease family protein
MANATQTPIMHRPRYLWRGGLNFLVFGAVIAVIQTLRRHGFDAPWAAAVLSMAAVACYAAGVRFIERRPVDELTTNAGPREVGLGFALGICLFSAVMLLLWALGVFQPVGFGSVAVVGGALLLSVLGATLEEILFRGLLFRLSETLVGSWGALTFTAFFFGAAHAFNNGATIGSSLAIALEAGVLLGAAYAATGRLWLPIGLHIGWNFAEGGLYGMSVSGGSARPSLIYGTLRGPMFLTGGAFGPEASLVAVVVCLVPAAFLLALATRRGRIKPLSFRLPWHGRPPTALPNEP